jgi:hypothetical protein
VQQAQKNAVRRARRNSFAGGGGRVSEKIPILSREVKRSCGLYSISIRFAKR